jgi:Abnormal spindle-like microcephaly-assoc'd, ASPM-SPD-2-Hydin
VLSSYCACGRRPIRGLDGLCVKLFPLLTFCFVVVAPPGCGYVANASVADTLRVSPSTPSDVSQLNVAGKNVLVNSQSSLPVAISPGATYSSDIGFGTGNVSNSSGQFTATNAGDKQIAQIHRGHGSSLSALSCGSASMTGSGSDNCTVTLSFPAGYGGMGVSLASSNAAVTVPATVTVAANATSAGFTAKVSSVTSAQTVTLTASAGGGYKSFAVRLNAVGEVPTVPTLTISTAGLTFGNVTVNTASTQPVTLTSTGTAPVTISSGTLSGTGFTMSGATFPVTLNPSSAVTLEVQFDPTATGAATGQLTIQSNSSTNSTAVISLSGTGESVVTEANLSWQAPSSSPVPIVGYNIYRSTGGSASYQLLNSSVDAQTTYVDGSVQAGLTYDYIVESVDSSGVESVPSNEATAIIP